jgi:hypothetical protein
MNNDFDSKIEKLCGCGLSIFAGFGIYLATANELGTSKIFALALALLMMGAVLLSYRIIVVKAAKDAATPYLGLIVALAIMIIVALNYFGLLNLWKALNVYERPFYLYAIAAAPLLFVSAWWGRRAVLRSGPIIVIAIILAIVFDTIFIIPKVEPFLLFGAPLKPFGEIFSGSIYILLALLGPALIFLLCVFVQSDKANQIFKW